jgi:hypothetical protein
MRKNKKQNREQKKEKKNHTWKKKMRFVFFFQTSNLHLIKQKYKSFFLITFIIKQINLTSEFFWKRK